MTRCTICHKKIQDDEGMFNLPSGIECVVCHEKPKLVPKYTNIAGYKIPTKLLQEYAEKVEFTRHSAIMGNAMDDPRLVMKALSDRVEIHKKIFKITGHDHESTKPEAMKIRKALEKWLEKNVMTHMPAGSLL